MISFGKTMLTDLNDNLYQTKDLDMYDRDILDNHSTRILDSKYEQVNTTKLLLTKNSQCHDLQYLFIKHKKCLIHKDTVRKGFQHMVNIGISEDCGASKWSSPLFLPKKMARSDKTLTFALYINV